MKSRLFRPEVLVFAGIVLLLVLWIGSGMIAREPLVEERPAPQVPVVAASTSEARPVDRELILYGEVQPTQIAILRSRTDGLLEEVADQGTVVRQGDELARLSADDREARLAQAQAQLAAATRTAEAAQQLADRGVGPGLEAQARQAELQAARAALRAIELDIENTTLRAPVSGIINRVILDTGSYVAPGGEVLEIVKNDPLLAIVDVQQSEIRNIRPGMPASVRFIGDQGTVEGRVSFVAPLADAATRTFRVEIEIPNPDAAIPAGISAEVRLVTDTIDAHFVSSALMRLDEQGRIGLYAVDDESRIVFHPIGFVTADSNGLWVTGLDRRVQLVTISQGAIAEGEVVEVRETPQEYSLIQPEDAASDSAASDAANAAAPDAGTEPQPEQP
ncbi:efflux RND transporter periplasmic adaptor subunit [uncultured Paracoccus sp.]|uniref:efflux RND transporter periplasmic adaptor subunit n=1 Tax=uncultured Paracoccus sp. TaxID=189685 RepID=UPI0025D07757|nr:efflux RND transporter periplasmic adaptor subunit [uncultured Paracoccus sp.]